MIRMVVFDMAGTVIDENNAVYRTLLETLNAEGYHLSLGQVLAEGAGKEKFQAIRDILLKHTGIVDETVLQRIFRNFQNKLWNTYDTIEIRAQSGAEELFNELRRREIYTVLNTGYDLKTAQSILRKVDWEVGKQIDGMVTASEVANSRPAPDMIDIAKKKLGMGPSDHVVKVGDSAIDIEEGKNAKCRLSIGITTGAHSREQLLEAKPDFIVDSLLEILPLIENAH
jgi:phosphonatase-like hydrolase